MDNQTQFINGPLALFVVVINLSYDKARVLRLKNDRASVVPGANEEECLAVAVRQRVDVRLPRFFAIPW